MPNPEIMRIADGIARDKNIERDQVYVDIEQAIASGLRKQFNTEDTSEFTVHLDRTNGEISVTRAGTTVALGVMGRIGAQTVKQVMIQLLRQDERGSIYEEYKDRVGTIVTGTIARFEGGTMIVNLGRVEGIMPRSEQIPGEQHQVGERIQALITEVRGEKIDIVRWNESSQILIGNALKPAEVTEVALCFELGRATVVVNDDQLSLAIGKRGQNVRLAARLTGWDIDILTPPEFQAGAARLDQTLKAIEGVTQEMVDKIIALGLIDVRDIEEVGAGPLMEELQLPEELAQRVVDRCTEEAKIVAVEQEAKKAAEAKAKAANQAALLGVGARGVDGVAFANPLIPRTAEGAVKTEEVVTPFGDDAAAGRMPLATEATDGIAPELTTHKEGALGDAAGGELSPEEEAIQGMAGGAGAEAGGDDGKDYSD